MAELPPTLNLSDLQVKLAASGAFPALEKKIRQALVAQSCLADLREAVDCFDALQATLNSARGWRSSRRDVTEASLLASAIHLYARATVTLASRPPHAGFRERGPSQIHDALTDEQLLDHDALVRVRSQALAHVYLNREIDGEEWHSAAVLAVQTPAGWLTGAASRRIRLERSSVARLSRALPTAMTLMSARAEIRINEVARELDKASSAELDRLLGECWLDAEEFFGGAEAARRALGSVKAGEWIVFEGR